MIGDDLFDVVEPELPEPVFERVVVFYTEDETAMAVGVAVAIQRACRTVVGLARDRDRAVRWYVV